MASVATRWLRTDQRDGGDGRDEQECQDQ